MDEKVVAVLVDFCRQPRQRHGGASRDALNSRSNFKHDFQATDTWQSCGIHNADAFLYPDQPFL